MPPLPFHLDDGPGTRATLGVVVLRTDEAMEGDLRAFLPTDGVALHHTRLPFEPHVTAETLARMEGDLSDSVAMLPTAAPFDVIGYGCTSGSAVIGEDRIAARIHAVYPQARCTNPLSAAKAVFAALNIKKIALVTPYIPDVSETLRRRFAEVGVETVSLASFEQIDDSKVARITPQSIIESVIATASERPVDAVFAACTNLRTASVINTAESRLGFPVLSSNQTLAWHMMRLAGLGDNIPAMGMLAARA